MLVPGTIQDIESLISFLNRELSGLDNRLNNLDRGQGTIKLLAPLDANNFPIKNLPGPQRDPNNAIRWSEASALSPIVHAGTHENTGGDEISVAGLSGLLADAQDPLDHGSDHENTGGDEISVLDLSGLLADLQKPLDHTHQSAGSGVGGRLEALVIDPDTTNFDTILSSADDTVQKALDKLDDGGNPVVGKVNEVGGIVKGQAVCITGVTGDKPQISFADNTIHNCAHNLGIAMETKILNQNIRVMRVGAIKDVDTSVYTTGRLHLITSGDMQIAVPASGAHIHMGWVTKVDATEGTILVIAGEYLHDLRGVGDQQVEIACGDDDDTGFIYFQDYSRNNLGFMRGDGLFQWDGNVAIGTSDTENWSANFTVLQIGPDASIMAGETSSYGCHLNVNAYFDGAWKYRTADEASNYVQFNGTHLWRVAVSGPIDDPISWINAMDIDVTGKVTAAVALDVDGLATVEDITVLAGGALNILQTGTNRDISLTNSSSNDNIGGIAVYPPTGTNVASALTAIPRGTGFSANFKSQIAVFNTDFNADPLNYEALVLRAAGSNYAIFESRFGSGGFKPLFFTTGGNPALPDLSISIDGLIGINEADSDAMFEIVTNATTEEGLKVKGSATQTGSLFILTDHLDNRSFDSGSGLAGSEVVWNQQGLDINHRIESATEDKLFLVDSGTDTVRFGDGDTNYFVTDKNGNSWWVGEGSGLPRGSVYGNEIGWTQAGAVQNQWYLISDASMTTGRLNEITHDGNGQVTVAKAGDYEIHWYGAFEADAANVHIQIAPSVNSGAPAGDGLNHMETVGVNRQDPCAGDGILDLAANDTVEMAIRTTDAGAPDLTIDHLGFTLVMVGGT